MKKSFRWLLLIPLISFGLFAAQRSIVSVTVPAHGYFAEIKIYQIDTGGVFHTGIDTPSCIPINPRMIFTVVSMGYDTTGAATTRTRTVYGTIFKHDVAPRALLPDWTHVSADTAIVRVALSEEIYAKDKAGAGNSGVNISYVITPGLYINGQDTSAASTGTVINNSTLVYPKVIYNWTIPPYQSVKGASFNLKGMGIHKHNINNGQPLACVTYTVTDQHSHTVTSTTGTARKDVSATLDPIALPEHIGVISTSTLTALDSLTCNFSAYPWIGDTGSVLRSANGSVLGELAAGPLIMFNNKSGTYGNTCGCVDSANGSDITGKAKDSSVFFAGADTCFKTIGGAANGIAAFNNSNHGRNEAGGGYIYLKAGRHAWTGETVTSSVVPRTYINIARYPGVSFDSVSITTQAGSRTIGDKVHIQGIRLIMMDNGTYFWANDRLHLWIDQDSVIANGEATFYYQMRTYATNCKFGAINSNLIPYSGAANYCNPLLRGNRFSNSLNVAYSVYVGNISTATVDLTAQNIAGTSNPYPYNAIVAYNKALNRTGDSYWLIQFEDSTVRSPMYGTAIYNNVVESKSGTNQPGISIANTNNANTPVDNVIIQYNSVAGTRWNIAYNDYGINGLGPYYRERWSIMNNIIDKMSVVTSGDVHGGVPDSSCHGNYSLTHGTGIAGNLMCERTNLGKGLYNPKFPGLYTYGHVFSMDTVTPGYITDNSLSGSGTGNGDYRLKASSPAIGLVQNSWSLPFDLAGNYRISGGAAGAYEYVNPLVLCTLTVVSGLNGSVSRNLIIDSSNVLFRDTAIAAGGYLVDTWSSRHGNVSFANAHSSFAVMTMAGSDTVDVSFRAWPTYTLTMVSGAGGAVTPSTQTVDSAASISIIATPNLHYAWSRWTRSGTTATISDSSLASSTVFLTGNATVTGNFTCSAPTLSYSQNPPCTVSVDFSQAVTATGFDSIVNITTLPAGLSINKLTGTISGLATTPASKAGFLIRAYGCSNTDFYDSLTVIAHVPIVSSITDAFGKTAGGKIVTIRGRHLANVDTVWFGTTSSIKISSKSDTTIVDTVPAHAKGTVNILVKSPVGKDTLVNGFTYANIYGVTLSPARGDTIGGTAITVTANYGLGGGGMSLGGINVSGWTVTDSTLAAGTSGAHAKGSVLGWIWNTVGDSSAISFRYGGSAAGGGKRRGQTGSNWSVQF